MLDDALPHSWSKVDDKKVVQAMLSSSSSVYWQECLALVYICIRAKAENISEGYWDDIAQEVMMRVTKYLSSFKFECAFKTWIITIVSTCIVDFHRKSKHTRYHIPLPSETYYEGRQEDMIAITEIMTTEEAFLKKEQLQKAIEGLKDYVDAHAKPERNLQILEMSLLEGHSHEDIARVVGCSAPVVGYVVRSAQRYVREKQ